MAICQKESAKINGNTFEIVIGSLLAEGRWKVSTNIVGVCKQSLYRGDVYRVRGLVCIVCM